MKREEQKKKVLNIRNDFPIFKNSDLIYLDSAATSQKPECVLRAQQDFYEKYNANPYRGMYELGEAATEQYEQARETVRHFLNAKSSDEIVFTRNATEGLNLLSYSLADHILQPGDEILITIMEHHSNLLPWQLAAKRHGANLCYIECNEEGEFTEEDFKQALTPKTKIVSMTQVSNVLGYENNIKRFAQIAHENGSIFIADGAQSVPHMPVDVQDLDVDFLSFSGHKMLAPMGIGVLYGKKKWLEEIPPFLSGGEMIQSVTRDHAVYAKVPHKFEAGTVNAGGAAALGAAIHYYEKIGFDFIQEQEQSLSIRAMEALRNIKGIHILGSKDPKKHHGIISFTLDGVHPHDIAAILDADHIAIRAGHHCAQPLLKHLGVLSAARVSLAFYNTENEIDKLAESVGSIRRRMGYVESDVL